LLTADERVGAAFVLALVAASKNRFRLVDQNSHQN